MPANLLVRKRKVHQNRLIVTKLYSFLAWLPENHANSRGSKCIRLVSSQPCEDSAPEGEHQSFYLKMSPCDCPGTGQEWRVVLHLHDLVTKHRRKLNSVSLVKQINSVLLFS